tara:strand:- start:638 stop:1060 length:423 start_codon:yes stop_codon:yes gene_type:complete
MDVVITTTPANLGEVAEDAVDEVKVKIKSALLRASLVGINVIQDRTAKGQSYKGGAFKPYSEQYAVFRQKIGAQQQPNLEVSGRMLGAMTSKANHKQAEIFFRGAEESRKASQNEKTRPFFGFSRMEEKRLAEAFERAMT